MDEKGLQAIGAPVPSEARNGWNWFSSFWYGTRLPLRQRGATQKMNCTVDLCSSFLYGTRLLLGQRGATLLSWAVYSLFCSSLSQTQSCPIPKRGADKLSSQSCSLLSQRQSCPIQKFCGALLTERTVCGMVKHFLKQALKQLSAVKPGEK